VGVSVPKTNLTKLDPRGDKVPLCLPELMLLIGSDWHEISQTIELRPVGNCLVCSHAPAPESRRAQWKRPAWITIINGGVISYRQIQYLQRGRGDGI